MVPLASYRHILNKRSEYTTIFAQSYGNMTGGEEYKVFQAIYPQKLYWVVRSSHVVASVDRHHCVPVVATSTGTDRV